MCLKKEPPTQKILKGPLAHVVRGLQHEVFFSVLLPSANYTTPQITDAKGSS